MPKHIQKSKKLLVISDTGMCLGADNSVKAFGPVVKELRNLLKEFDEITWIGFKRQENKSYIYLEDKSIKTILLKQVGGKTLFKKIGIIFSYPKMMFVILKEIKKHTYIHTRAPSNPAIIAMFLSVFFVNKKFWHKYAGTWIDEASLFYKFQRFILKKLRRNSKITINGKFSNKKNIIPFENPCLDSKDRKVGKILIEEKNRKEKSNFCFVGGLTSNKGVDDIIDVFRKINNKRVGEIHFVGDGPDKERYIELSKNIQYKCIFHGFLAKDDIVNIYKNSHFILLPSKSEGFPKVIGEAMNYGCIPIVSNISCIGEYIKNNKNGFLIEKPYRYNLELLIHQALNLKKEDYLKWINFNYNLAEKFTYSYFNSRIKNEIFNIKKA